MTSILQRVGTLLLLACATIILRFVFFKGAFVSPTDIATTHAVASSDMYLFIEGIPGEATAQGYENRINLESFSNEIQGAVSGVGSARSRFSSTHSDLQLSKILDKSSPKLAEAASLGTVVPLVKLELTRTDGEGKSIPYYMYELKNVRVTRYQVGGSSGETPSDSFSLNFEEIKVTYKEIDTRKGETKGNIEYSRKVEKGTK